MIVVCVLDTARRLAFYSALPLFLTALACPSYSQTSAAPSQQCDDAQVIAIQGGWIANPGGRPLGNWSCVSAEQEIALANDSLKGEITVIYHRGGKPPHTVRCGSREQCRNAYRVEAPPAITGVPKSTVDRVLDFFFSIFSGSELQPVPGILHGAIHPRPALTCSVGKNVRLENILKPGLYNLHVMALNTQAEDVTWQAENTVDDRAHGAASAGETPSAIIGGLAGGTSKHRTSHSRLLMSQPLDGPAFYEVETWPVGSDAPNASYWVLIAPEASCDSMTRAYKQAVSFTETWPKDTPDDAIQNFRLRYLQGLANEPEKAPKDRVHR